MAMKDKKAAAFSLSAGVIAGSAAGLLVMLIFAFASVKMQTVQTAAYVPVSTAALCAADFTGGLICSAIMKQNGMMYGSISAALVFFVFFLISAAAGAQPDVRILLRLAAMLPLGALGGVIGVNAKKKRKRRK